MKARSWLWMMAAFLAAGSLWAGYVSSRRAFLNDFNGGVHAYLAGQFSDAERSLRKALKRRPRDAKVRQLLVKVLIEQSYAQYRLKDFSGAQATLSEASALAPEDAQTKRALDALRDQFSAPSGQRPVPIRQVLAGLYERLPISDQPASLPSLLEQWSRRNQANQNAMLGKFRENQERWLAQLEKEKDQFRAILYGGLALFGAGGIVLLALLLGILHAYFGRRGVFSRLLDDHYRRLVAALPAGSQVLLGPPMNLHDASETKKLDAIEAEIVSGASPEESHRRLQILLEGENPWMRARAAKILYRLNPKLALEELARLVSDPSPEAQVPGMWALTELATKESLALLAPLAYSPVREIQQGTVRSLLQIQAKESLDGEARTEVSRLLAEIRTKTGWIF